MMTKFSSLCARLGTIVDDLLLCASCEVVEHLIEMIKNKFTLGTTTHVPGLLRYYGLNIMQHDDHSVPVDVNDKLQALEAHRITRVCRWQLESLLNAAEAKALFSINSCIYWLCIALSLFCSLFSSMLQQFSPTGIIAALYRQATILKELKRFETLSCYACL